MSEENRKCEFDFDGDMLIVRIQQENAATAKALCRMLQAEQQNGNSAEAVIGASGIHYFSFVSPRNKYSLEAVLLAAQVLQSALEESATESKP